MLDKYVYLITKLNKTIQNNLFLPNACKFFWKKNHGMRFEWDIEHEIFLKFAPIPGF